MVGGTTGEVEVLDMLRVDFTLRVRLVGDSIGCECEQHVARSEQAARQQRVPKRTPKICVIRKV